MALKTHRILFGTTNPSKIDIIRAFLENLPIELITPIDMGIRLVVREDGKSTEENAEIKARAYYSAAQVPTLAIDAGLTIGGFPPDKQPGVYVRRIFGTDQEVSDQQMLDYYIGELKQMGGQSVAYWKVATAFTLSPAITFVDTYTFEAQLLSQPSPKLNPGTPLSSLMVDPHSGKYFSEIDHRQRADAEWVKAIMQQNLARWDDLCANGQL
jgi:inosine/xanthosine triphosphate pyrophosphatase family protein